MKLSQLSIFAGVLVAVAGAWWTLSAWRMDTQAPGARVEMAGQVATAPPVHLEALEEKRDELMQTGAYTTALGGCLVLLGLVRRRRKPRPLYEADDVLVESILAGRPPRDGRAVAPIAGDEDITEPAPLPRGDREEQDALATIERAGYTIHRYNGRWILSDGRGTLQSVYSRSDLIARARDLDAASSRSGTA